MKDSIIFNHVSLRKVLEAINATPPAGIAFVKDQQGKLCGIVTDGDFRRLLLDGYNLDDTLSDIELGNFIFAKHTEPLHDILKRVSHKIRIIPMVNDDFELIDYIQLDKRFRLPVAIPDLNNGNELKYLTDAFLSSWISSQGAYINRFEEEFAAYCDMQHGVATANGTVAIHLALKALGIGEGDEVILPDLTFAATINAVLHSGATPVIVDINEEDWCIDPEEIKKAISPSTKAVIPVHVYGQPCQMDVIQQICEDHQLYIVEDAAEAHGAEFKGQKIGSFGDISTFSFFANKIITTGEGGMCLTHSQQLSDKMKVLRDHGMNKQKRYWHDEVGYNYRMTNMQAAIGCAQLERIQDILMARDQLEAEYKQLLEGTGLFRFQKNFDFRKKSVWLVSALYEGEDKEEFMKHMNESGIDIRSFFYPLSTMPVFQQYTFSNKNSIKVSSKGINFPTHWNVDLKSIQRIVDHPYLNTAII